MKSNDLREFERAAATVLQAIQAKNNAASAAFALDAGRLKRDGDAMTARRAIGVVVNGSSAAADLGVQALEATQKLLLTNSECSSQVLAVCVSMARMLDQCALGLEERERAVVAQRPEPEAYSPPHQYGRR